MKTIREVKRRLALVKCIILLLLLLTVSNTVSQTIQNNFVHFTQREGLPSNDVSAIIQDHLGYIWIGSNNGLSRYDGYEFHNFSVVKDDSNFLQLPLVTALYEDSNGNILVGSVGGISIYNREKETFKLFSINEFEKAEERTFVVTSFCESKEGDYLIGMADMFYRDLKNGLYIIAKGSNKVELLKTNDDSTNVILNISRIDSNRYFLSGANGLAEYNHRDKNILWFPMGDEKIVTALLQDENNVVWLGILNKEVYSYNTKDQTYEKFPLRNHLKTDNSFLIINDMMFDDNHDLLITTNRGLAQLDRETKKVTYAKFDITNPSALHSNDLDVIMKDKTGSLWISSNDAGISKYNTVQNNFRSYYNNPNDSNSIEPGWVTSIFEYDDNELWFQSTRRIVSKFDRRNEIFDNVNLPAEAFYIYRDRTNLIWIAASDGLYKLNDRNWSVEKVNFPVSMEDNVIYVLLEDKKNTFWVGTSSGLYTYNRENNLTAKIDFEKLGIGTPQSNQIFNLVEDKSNNIWIGTNNGLFKYSYTDRQYTRAGMSTDYSKSLNSQDVNSLYIDTQGTVWVGTWLGGLNKLNPNTGKIKSYTKSEGFNSHSVQGILGDEENGALWLSSFDGISRFDIEKEEFQDFGVDDGVQGNQFAHSSAFKTSDGLFVFGGQNGVTMFKPENIKSDLVPPAVIITDFKIFNESIKSNKNNSVLQQPIYKTKNITLNYDQNDISFEFLAVHYANPKKNKYAYRLKNYADEWRYVGNQRIAIFPNLPNGDYLFQVKAANNNNVWNDEGKSVNIKILPPWWKTTWSYIGYLLIFIVGVFTIDRTQRKRLLRKAKEKMKIQEAEYRAETAELQAKTAETQSKLIQVENERKTKELEEARQLQLSMLPKELPQLPNLNIAVYMQTATEVGGDYYDFHVGMDGTLTVVVGDATGHGMKAGTMVTTTKSLFNILAPNSDILTTFSEMSRVIKGMEFHQLSMCLMLLKIKEDQLFVSSAAMPPALIYRKKNQAIEEIFMKGMPLGAMNNFPYSLKESHLEQGDTILLLTDGFPELKNDSNEMYGYDRTKTEFHSVGEKEPEEIVEHLKDSASQWVNGKDPDDDVTFVVIKVK